MNTKTKHYDAIIIGGGHNGLICAAYLARAGHDVLVAASAIFGTDDYSAAVANLRGMPSGVAEGAP